MDTTGSTPEPTWSIGSRQIVARLGSGPMGEVYLGRSPDWQLAAVTLVHPRLADNPEFRARFSHEVAAASRVSGPVTVPVIDADPNAQRPWLATAHVPGVSLGDAVHAAGPLPEPLVHSIGAGIAEGLRSVHGAGLVHGALKPANVLLSSAGPRILDAGVARAADSVTAGGQTPKTPVSMSPEQTRGQEPTAPSDVFSLGVVLCYACGGREPFGDEPDESVLHRILHEEPDLGAVPPGLRDVVAHCLCKDPGDRPGLGDLAGVLGQRAAQGQGVLPPPVTALIQRREEETRHLEQGGPATGSAPAAQQPAPRQRGGSAGGHTGWIIAAAAGGLAVLLVGAVATFWFLPVGGGSSDSPQDSAEAIRAQTDLAKPGEARAESVAPPALTPVAADPDEHGLGYSSFESIEFSPDGALVYLSSYSERVTAVDVESGEVEFETDFTTMDAAAVSPDGEFLAAVKQDPDESTEAENIVVADATTGEELNEIEMPAETGYTGITFTPDSELVTSHRDAGTTVWDPETGEQTGTVAPEDGGDIVTVSSDGSLFAFHDDGVEVWTVKGEEVTKIDYDLGSGGTIAFQPGTSLLTAWTQNQAVQFWDAVTGASLGAIPVRDYSGGMGLEYHPDGHMLLVWGEEQATVVNADTQTEAGSLELPTPDGANTEGETVTARETSHLAISPDGNRLAAAGFDDPFLFWDIG